MFVERTAEAAWCTGAVRCSAALETHRRYEAGSIHGGSERHLRPASGAEPTLAHARGRAGGRGAVGSRYHDPRRAPRYRDISPQAPASVCGLESPRSLALAAGGRAVSAARGTEAPTGTVREGHAQ